MREERTVAVLMDSLPPFKIAALPVTEELAVTVLSALLLTTFDGQSSDVHNNFGPSLKDDEQHADRTSHPMKLQLRTDRLGESDHTSGGRKGSHIGNTLKHSFEFSRASQVKTGNKGI